MTEASERRGAALKKLPTYCNQCVNGPDLFKVVVKDGVAVGVEPNFDFADRHPARGRVCISAYALPQKTYNPMRVRGPMKRTNPRKGMEEDPGWRSISWEEAFSILVEKLKAARDKGLLDANGHPRLAATFGEGGTPDAYYGSLNALLQAWGPIDFGFGTGQGVKCYHTEHLFGEFWHRAFIVAPDTPLTDLLISFGHNDNITNGVQGIYRHAQARARGMKRVQIEPHMSVTAAKSDVWIPIKPKTDAAFLYGMINVVLHELKRSEVCDLKFLRSMTNSPFLVGPHGYYLRDAKSRKPLVWDTLSARALPFDSASLGEAALEGNFNAPGVEVGPDGEAWTHESAECRPAFELLLDLVKPYTPEWAAEACDVSPESIRGLAKEFVGAAGVGRTVEVDGVVLPLRPVAILLGKSVTNGWGAYQAVWARTVLQTLVGALEVPGSIIGVNTRLNRPMSDRLESAGIGEDGFMLQKLNPTSKAEWEAKPHVRNAYKTLVPLVLDSSWSQALGPSTLPYMSMSGKERDLPSILPPDVWIVYKANPLISLMDPGPVADTLSKFPFTVCFAYVMDETNWFADLLLPESTDLESTQLARVGGTSYQEQFWDHSGVALRQRAVEPVFDTMDMTDISTEIASRLGLLDEYNRSINRGSLGFRLKTAKYDLSLAKGRRYDVDDIWDRVCRAATITLSNGGEEHGLDWFKENGVYLVPFKRINWYLHPIMVAKGLRYEVPYQERLLRVGEELGRRLHENGIRWWDRQLMEYSALPRWEDFPAIWDGVPAALGKKKEDFAFWLLTSKSMQYVHGANVGMPILRDVAGDMMGHRAVMMNADSGRRLKLRSGDRVVIESPVGKVRAKVLLREGVRPDVLVALGQFGHWVTPVAKDIGLPGMNRLVPMMLETTDGTGSAADLVRVRVSKERQ